MIHRRSPQPGRAFAAAAALSLSALTLLLAGIRPASPEPPAPTAEQAAFFETNVRPLLANSCYSCHGPDAQLGGLRLDSRAFALQGGKNGPSVVPGDPAKSLLITAVHQTGALKMPQGGKLKPEEIAALETWVKMGAPWPDKAPTGAAKAPDAWRNFWSLQPVKSPAIPVVHNKTWAKTPIDAFILAKLEAKNLTPAPAADRRTLLRRVTFDLTGLPPTPADSEAFLADKSPDAYEKVVDRLLASPRYGERWGRLWLDVARYADTKGYVFNEDRNYPYAYTYRDWVIHAFNTDLPYDKFVTYQLAADLTPEVKNSDDKSPLAALGYLTLGRRFLNSQPDIVDDRIDVTMRGLEAATVACARCHDHKFDPIPTADYYSLYGVFASSNESQPAISPPAISKPYDDYRAKLNANQEATNGLIRAEVGRLRVIFKDDAQKATLPEPVRQGLQAVREEALPDGDNLKKIEMAFTPEAKAKRDALVAERAALEKNAPPMPELAMALNDAPQPFNPYIFKRGNQGNHGDNVPRRFPVCLSPAGAPRPEWNDGSGRLHLAESIVSKDNPRTARVFVNRVWMHHFGNGLVRTPSDFGIQGEKPTHPELLDYLASQFMANGWSIKKLQRSIVLTATYRQISDDTPKDRLTDPENRLLAHQNRRRLDLEEMRDSLLWASGKLDTSKVGGKSEQLWSEPWTDRRAVYGFVDRQNLPGTFRTFDFATPDATNAHRFQTTIPQQALYLMNSPFATEQAITLAGRPDLQAASPTDEARSIRRLYLRLFDRLPDNDETAAGMGFLQATDPDVNVPLIAPPAWQYGFGGFDTATARTVGFTPFAQFINNQYQPATTIPQPEQVGYVSLHNDGGHPGRDAGHATIRRWVAPADMTVSISGMLNHPNANGDGVRGRIVSSRTGLVGEWMAHNNQSETNVPTLVVHKGDTIDFAVDCVTTDAFDSFNWSPTIRQIGGSHPGVWSSLQEYSGPDMTKTRRLTKWERYTQALLMTNEFMFVD